MMNKILTGALCALMLSACAGDGSSLNTGMSMGGSLVKAAVDNQCRTELNKRNEWRAIALAMTAEKQQEWEDKICGCASEEAPNQMSANELLQMAGSGRSAAVASVTAKTVTACIQRLYK